MIIFVMVKNVLIQSEFRFHKLFLIFSQFFSLMHIFFSQMIQALKHDMQVVLNIDSDLSIYVVVFSIQRCPNIGKIYDSL